jgi:hypothetical protein
MCNCGRSANGSRLYSEAARRAGITQSTVPVAKQSTRQAAPSVDINTVWGPPMWNGLHSFAELTSERLIWKKLTENLLRSIPCPDCKIHFGAWIQRHPLSGNMREWVAVLHNAVNERTGKAPWAIEQVIETYSEGGDRVKLAARVRSVHKEIRNYVGAPVAGYMERVLQALRL